MFTVYSKFVGLINSLKDIKKELFNEPANTIEELLDPIIMSKFEKYLNLTKKMMILQKNPNVILKINVIK